MIANECRLEAALFQEYELEWYGRFCELVLAARSYTTKRLAGCPSQSAAWSELAEAVTGLGLHVWTWRLFRFPLNLEANNRDEAFAYRNLAQAAIASNLWHFQPKNNDNYEVAELRARAFYRAASKFRFDEKSKVNA